MLNRFILPSIVFALLSNPVAMAQSKPGIFSWFGQSQTEQKEPETQEEAKMREYREKVAKFNAAADRYLNTCEGHSSRSKECINAYFECLEHIEYAKVYSCPDTLQKRVKVAQAMRDREIAERNDIGAQEKRILTECYKYGEERYSQIELYERENKDGKCAEWVKDAVELFKSVDPEIKKLYSRVAEKEARQAHTIKMETYIKNLCLPVTDPVYKQTVELLKKDFDLYKAVCQELKRAPWITYKQTGDPEKGWRVYPGLFKAYIVEEELTSKDIRTVQSLTEIAQTWLEKKAIPAEPSYQEQKGKEEIGEGCSIPWALLRYAAMPKQNESTALSPERQKMIVDEIVIRCGNRENKSMEKVSAINRPSYETSADECAKLVATYKSILKVHGVKGV